MCRIRRIAKPDLRPVCHAKLTRTQPVRALAHTPARAAAQGRSPTWALYDALMANQPHHAAPWP